MKSSRKLLKDSGFRIMSKERFPALVVLCISVMLHYVYGGNMWIADAPTPTYGDTLPGRIISDNAYQTTCGWKLTLRSSTVIDSISDWNVEPVKIDDYTYRIGNKQYSHLDMASAMSLVLKGPFGAVNPTITVSWYCVCNATTAGLCEPVSHNDNSITSASAASPSYLEFNPTPSNDSILHLEKQSSLCYTGLYSRLSNMRGLLNCGWICLQDMNCLGVNYWASRAVCNFVYEDTDSISGLTGIKAGCEYYKVIGRGH